MPQLDRDYIKKNYPNIYKYLLGGERADDYTAKNIEGKNAVAGAGKAAGAVASAGFDIVVWLKDNWQLAVVGVVALLVLLRD